MGGVPSTRRHSGEDTVEYLIATFVGEKSFPLTSEFWNKLLELPLSSRWSSDRVRQACEIFAQNNGHTRHLAKLLIHLSWCLQESVELSVASSSVNKKAANAVYFSSVFLNYLIENSNRENLEELHLSLDESEPLPQGFVMDQNIENFVMHGVLRFIGSTDISPNSYLLHQELLNFMLVAMSTQLLSGPSPDPRDVNPFIDAAIAQEKPLVTLVVKRLLLSYILQPCIPSNATSHLYSEGNHTSILERVGSAAAPLNLLVNTSGVSSRNLLADCSLHVLLILIHYHKCVMSDESMTDKSDDSSTSNFVAKRYTLFSENPYRKALGIARDIEFDRADVEGNACSGPLVRIPFASLYDTLGICLADESAVLLLYSLLQGNSDFLEYVLVRADMDTLLMPILETLYNTTRRKSNQIYMMLIVLLILSQDSSFNASIHKLILPGVQWYKEHRLHQTSFGSLMVVVLIRTVQHNLSKLQDVYLHTTCLATLANMAPHVHRLSSYASQKLVSLFYMLSRKYNKLSEVKDGEHNKGSLMEQDGHSEDVTAELQIYTDFLRIVLEILNAILTYALPRNPEVVYAIMHRQEVFQPFKNHPRFHELVENIYTVLDFFNTRMDSHQRLDGEWSAQKVLQLIDNNCRSWRGEGMKMFTQLHFSYEQESHPEEFFIPYVWQLVLSRCGFNFDHGAIKLFPADPRVENKDEGEPKMHQNGAEVNEKRIILDP